MKSAIDLTTSNMRMVIRTRTGSSRSSAPAGTCSATPLSEISQTSAARMISGPAKTVTSRRGSA